jgi:hypothetical protein
MSKGNISIIYRVEYTKLLELKKIFTSLREFEANLSDEKSNFNEILRKYSSVQRVSFKGTLSYIYFASFFKNDEEFLENYISFSFVLDDCDIVVQNSVLSLLEEFLAVHDLDIKILPARAESKYIRYMTEDESQKSVEISKMLSLTKAEKIETYLGEVDKDHEQYIYKKTNTVVEYCLMESNNTKRRNFERVNIFMLSLAYANYYKNKTMEISQRAFNMKIEDYDDILQYSADIARFEATYYFSNPTNKYYYDGFFKYLDIETLHNEFITSLNGLIKFVGLLHTKQESQKSQISLQREQKIDKRVNIVMAMLGVILAILALPGIL